MTASASTKAWRCTVCGYIHRAADPPDCCPVCGSDKTDFEPHAEAAAPVPAAAPLRWRCLNCGYVHVGPKPPDECPVCGAAVDRFEPAPEEGVTARGTEAAGRVLVIGAGVAGVSTIEALRRAAPNAAITLVAKESSLPYYRLNLTRYLAGELTAGDLPIHPAEWYAQQRVELLTGAEVADLEPGERRVRLRDGRTASFDRLVITCGAHPFVPPFPGTHLDGVSALRTLADAEHIMAAARAGHACVVIGGGLLGLETAGALARQGADVTLLEGHEWLMPRQLNRRAGELLMDFVRGSGVKLRTKANTTELVGDERVSGVQLKDGAVVRAEFVILAAGVRPNSYLARRAGLEVNQGIVVNNRLFTSHPQVLAAGDVAEHHGLLYGSWGAAQYQGSIAGLNAAGVDTEFGGIPRSNTLKVLGVELLSIGKFEPEDASYVVLEQEAEGKYLRFLFRDGNLVGAILLGDTSISTAVKKAVETRTDFSGVLAARPRAADIRDHLKQTAP